MQVYTLLYDILTCDCVLIYFWTIVFGSMVRLRNSYSQTMQIIRIRVRKS